MSQNLRTTAIWCNISEAGCFFIDLSTTSLIILNATVIMTKRTGGGEALAAVFFVNTAAKATEKHPQTVETVSDLGPEPYDLYEAAATLRSVRCCH
jgi:hypothetical protein